jgi:hypothetical protein
MGDFIPAAGVTSVSQEIERAEQDDETTYQACVDKMFEHDAAGKVTGKKDAYKSMANWNAGVKKCQGERKTQGGSRRKSRRSKKARRSKKSRRSKRSRR